MREFIRRLLADDYDVRAVDDGREAFVAATADPPDVVLSDVVMPNLDGLSLLHLLRARPETAAIPVILISAHTDEDERVQGLGFGVDGYLIKPFSARELLARVGGAVALGHVRREANAALRESEERFRNLADHAPVMVWVAEPDGTISFLSKSWYEFTGQTPGEIIADAITEAVHPDDRDRVVASAQAALVRREPYREEHRLRRRDGEYRWVLCAAVPRLGGDGRFLGFVGSILDITERKRAEDAVADERTRLRHLLGQVPAIINFLRGPELTFEYAHPRLSAMLGGRELIGRAALDAMPELTEGPYLGQLHRVYWTGVPEHGTDVRGDTHWRYVFLPVRGPGGEIEGVMTFDIDVTAEVRARQRVEALMEKAEAATRAKDEFLAMLGHELRNPLAPIVATLDILQLRSGGTLARELGVIERQVDHLRRLVDDLLDVSKIARGKITLERERLSMRAMVMQAVEVAGALLDERQHRVRVLAAADVQVEGDRHRLIQVFANLLTNAAKYTEPGGRVEVRLVRAGAQAVVTVRDSGNGIPAELLPRIFERFAQGPRSVDRGAGGLGLGLAIVKSLVELHGGTVEAASPGPGRGSTFTVRLPIAPPARAGTGSEAAAPAEVRRRRILVVDDNLEAARALAGVLEVAGHEVTVAGDGRRALEVAATFRPEVAFLDLGMPVMDGFELARRLGEEAPEPPAMIALTGYGQEADRARTTAAGFAAHLTKPARLADLEQALAEVEQRG